MSAAAPPKLMTIEEFDALPDDGVDRWLVRGELRKAGMTSRNQFHSSFEARIALILGKWWEDQPTPRGRVVSGEAGFILRRGTPDSSVGTDVAYISPEVLAATPVTASFFEGPPVLAVEILSPSDVVSEVDEKIQLYLETGVKVIWTVNPTLKTILVTRPDTPHRLYTPGQVLDGEPDLPGFRVEVDRIFAF